MMRNAKMLAMLLLPLGVVLFLIGWSLSYVGSNKVEKR